MDSALDPLDLVRHSARKKHRKRKPNPRDDKRKALIPIIQTITQEAADLINTDRRQEFFYKNPNGWSLKKVDYAQLMNRRRKVQEKLKAIASLSDSLSYDSPSSSGDDDDNVAVEPWSLIEDFKFPTIVQEINDFIYTWQLSPATKFVVIGKPKSERIEPFGSRYFAEAHFSKPTPKCPNPLAVAKVYFQINVCDYLPKDYPLNVTYKFEGYDTCFYAMGENKLKSAKFQRFFIDTILRMRLAFYAKMCDLRNPQKPTNQSEEDR